MANKYMTEQEVQEITKAFEDKGYRVIKIKRWHEGEQPYVTITRGSLERLGEASEFGRTLGVVVCQPC